MNTHLPNSLREVQTRSQQIERQIDTIVRGNPDFSLVDLIASKVPDAPRRFTTPEETRRALEYASDLHNACRASEPPNSIGHLVPLAAMARALTTGTSASFISGNKSTEVPAGFAQRSALLGGGATVLQGLRGASLALFRLTKNITGEWLGETADTPAHDPEFGVATLVPSRISARVVVSRQMLRDSTPDLNTTLTNEILRQLGAQIDAMALGANGTPSGQTGVFNNADIEVVSVGANGAAPTWAHIATLENKVSRRTGQNGARNPAFIGHPDLTLKLRTTQRVAGGDRMILEDAELLGAPYLSTTAAPTGLTKGTAVGTCSALLYGDLSEVFIGFWGLMAIDLIVNPFKFGKQGAIEVLAQAEVGVAVRSPGAFAMYRDLVVS